MKIVCHRDENFMNSSLVDILYIVTLASAFSLFSKVWNTLGKSQGQGIYYKVEQEFNRIAGQLIEK